MIPLKQKPIIAIIVIALIAQSFLPQYARSESTKSTGYTHKAIYGKGIPKMRDSAILIKLVQEKVSLISQKEPPRREVVEGLRIVYAS